MSKSDNAAWKTAEADSAAQRHMGVRPSLVPTGETGVLIRLTPVGAPDPVVSIGRLHALSPVGIEVNCDQVPLWLNQEVYVAFEYQGQMIQGLCFFVSSEALDQGSILFCGGAQIFLRETNRKREWLDAGRPTRASDRRGWDPILSALTIKFSFGSPRFLQMGFISKPVCATDF